MKKILLLGGSRYLLPVIKSAHELGLYVITCDYLPDNIAHKYSDEYVNVSIIDKEAVLEAAKKLEIDGIMSFATDPGVVTAAYVAEKLGISEAKAYSVASFYENFSFEAKGKYVIKVCDGTACHVRKSIPILEGLYKELGLGKKKHTTDDQLFTVETVSCLGACGLAPAVMVNDEVHPKMTPEKMSELIKKLREEEE